MPDLVDKVINAPQQTGPDLVDRVVNGLPPDPVPQAQQQQPGFMSGAVSAVGGDPNRQPGVPFGGRPEDKAAIDATRAFLGDIRDKIHNGNYMHAFLNLSQLLPNPLGDYGENIKSHATQAMDDLHNGRYGAAAAHVGAAMLPQYSQAANDIQQGNTAEGLGRGVGTTLATVAGFGSPEAAGNPVTMLKSPPGINKFTKPMIEALQPANSLQTASDLNIAGPEIKRVSEQLGEPVNGLYHTSQLVKIAKAENRAEMNKLRTTANFQGATGDGNGIADAMIRAIPADVERENPAAYGRLVKLADTYRGPIPVGEEDEILRSKNAQLDKLLNGLPTAQSSSTVGNAKTAMLQAQAQALRTTQYDALDRVGAPGAAKELQRRWGALDGVERELEKTQNAQLKQSTQKPNPLYNAYAALKDPRATIKDKILTQKPQDLDSKIASAFQNVNSRPMVYANANPTGFSQKQLPPATPQIGPQATQPGFGATQAQAGVGAYTNPIAARPMLPPAPGAVASGPKGVQMPERTPLPPSRQLGPAYNTPETINNGYAPSSRMPSTTTPRQGTEVHQVGPLKPDASGSVVPSTPPHISPNSSQNFKPGSVFSDNRGNKWRVSARDATGNVSLSFIPSKLPPVPRKPF